LIQRLFGYLDLFCNNCNMEYKGFAVPWALKRLPSTNEEFPGNKRRAPRIRAQLAVSVSLVEVDPVSAGLRYSPELEGQTRLINKYGMAIVLPQIQLGRYNFADTNRRLRLKLYLPGGAINIHLSPVHSEPVRQGKPKAGWLVGARITKISDEDGRRLAEYLDSLEQGKSGG
jgi:hypothetical protein